MVLHITPYSSSCLCFLDGLSWSLVFPCYWLLDQLLASCVATSLEKRQRSQEPCSLLTLCVLIMAPLYLLLLLTSLPFALLGFIIWAPLQVIRQPYLYTYCRPDKHQAEQGEAGSGFVGVRDWKPQGKSFCFCSANVCLLPNSLARFNNLSDTHGRAWEVGKRIRIGACRPQIKIYIDSPTNTSISATSFSSLATGFRRTSSLDQRPDQTHIVNGPAEHEAEPLAECPIHPSGATGCPIHPSAGVQASSEGPIHSDAGDTTVECPLHPGETNSNLGSAIHTVADAAVYPMHAVADGADCPMHAVADGADCPMYVVTDGPDCPLHAVADGADCPVHATGARSGLSNHGCPMHGKEMQTKITNECPLHTAGVQISISAPEPDPQEEAAETGNHQPRELAGDDTGNMTASRESLARYHGGDGGGVISSNNTLSHVPRTSMFKRPGRKRRHGDETFDHEISAFFPANLDFLALQEVFDHGSTSRLRQQLHRYFPYVLSDVGRYGWKGCGSSFKFFNSGLMLASRYPILDARYECYPNGRGEDALAAKGALFAKVHVGTSHQDQRVVGYLTCTHLHAIEEDKLEQQHALFTLYKDPCRQGPGEDKPWALGTLLDPRGLYDDEVSSPESLQKVMENEDGRKEYLVFPPSKSQCPSGSQKGRKIPLKGNGRRIDYILYSDEGLQQDWKLEVEEVSFVTQLAGLTDHLPVAMRLAVSTVEEES
ncbi:sphingomyelin phosphodiesterase 3 isoform X2 [Dunckerocampus dactyliophorus]|uniref:sphingomyelin phosphodiesterase 3 isoform X2 n=1 Tax=Dunckerocampus dactyliophorus TaxID=161453 RepID=UPI002406BEBD|nr:sphingomyelin phosphodiesterase 3 isoform X2 [Dunckerocampus dactyliophorus]